MVRDFLLIMASLENCRIGEGHRNIHYSVQTGHAARSEYHNALRRFGDGYHIKPWISSETWRRRVHGGRVDRETGQ